MRLHVNVSFSAFISSGLLSMSLGRLRVAVVGAGRMGGNHARILAGAQGVELVAIVDQNANKAARIATQHGCASFDDPALLVGKVDAVTIATPSPLHASVGDFLLGNGIACLIEKPLALTEEDCLRLIATSEAKQAPLAVGHIERFNPAVARAAEFLADQKILAIETRRLNPGSARIQDNDVVSDLMVHDLDIVLHLMGRAPTSFAARGLWRRTEGLHDHVTALLSFGPNCHATLIASRVTHIKVRDIQVLTEAGLVTVDFVAQQATFMRSHEVERRSVAGMPTPAAIEVEPLPVRQAEPLAVELSTFLDAVRAGRMDAGVPGRDALAALRAVWAIQKELAAS
jgi:predicted dehydrogenase